MAPRAGILGKMMINHGNPWYRNSAILEYSTIITFWIQNSILEKWSIHRNSGVFNPVGHLTSSGTKLAMHLEMFRRQPHHPRLTIWNGFRGIRKPVLKRCQRLLEAWCLYLQQMVMKQCAPATWDVDIHRLKNQPLILDVHRPQRTKPPREHDPECLQILTMARKVQILLSILPRTASYSGWKTSCTSW
jgi:hypothetical protein